MQFGKFDIGLFLRDHWQRQPPLIRNPWTGWTNPLEPDELAGIAHVNFRYACIFCNGRRIDVQHGTAGGKADRFPLVNEGRAPL